MDIVKLMFSRKWILTTLLAVIAAGVMVRLGIWQLDRLDQRRALNARVQAQLDAPLLDLNAVNLDRNSSTIKELGEMEYRSVTVRGEYDFENEVVLRNQVYQNLLGIHLLTPLKIEGSDQVILVDRGFAPMEDFNTGNLSQYQEPGVVEVNGYLRASQTRPVMGRATDPAPVPGERLDSFYVANVERINAQTPYPLLPALIVQTPDEGYSGALGREPLQLELSEGSHFGYALQWFAFAAILLGGYPYFVKKTAKEQKLKQEQKVETQQRVQEKTHL